MKLRLKSLNVNSNENKTECLRYIQYSPATESIQRMGGISEKGEGEYYRYIREGKKFKTKEEALDYCMSIKRD